MVFFFIHTFFLDFILLFSHSFKGIHRKMYLSFMLATFRKAKNSFLNKCEKKTMKKTVIAVKKCS